MENRPIIKIQENLFQKLMNRLSLLLIGLSAIYIMFIYHKLPNRIPIHFNFMGDVDNWGPKWSIIILWGVGLIIYFLYSKTQSFPDKFNYIVKITEQNAERQYTLALKMMSFLKFEVIILISYLLWSVVQNALNTVNQLDNYVMIFFVICIFITLVFYMLKSRKYS